MRNVLTRAVGTQEDLEVDLISVGVADGDVLLLCSDGLYGPAPEEEIAAVLADSQDLNVACQDLLDAANSRGGPDNISVILIRIDRAPPPEAALSHPQRLTRKLRAPHKRLGRWSAWVLAGAAALILAGAALYFLLR